MVDYESITDSRFHAIRLSVENSTKKIKPALRGMFFKELPEVMSAICDTHGEYEFQVGKDENGDVIDYNGTTPIHSMCMLCTQERQEEINRIAFEKYERETKTRITDKLSASGVSPRNMDKSFDSYIAKDEKQKKALSIAVEYARRVCAFDNPFNLIMVGTTGTGKTHLAHAITNHCILSGRTCATIQLKNLIAEYRASWSDKDAPSDRQVIKKYGSMNALVIDEIGLEEATAGEKVAMFEVLDERYNNQLSTVFISNQNADKLKEILGDRIVDRIKEDGCEFIAMKWKSVRDNL